MARINDNYLRLKSSYLFSEIAKRVKAYQDAHPDAKLIRLGIGDATRPLPPAIVQALHAAVDEMARAETFRGYGPETGYEFLTELIAKHDYGARGVTMAPDEIFVSDGSKSDAANFQELFSPEAVVALTDPVYPVYLDSNVMAGRAGAPAARGGYERIVYLPCTAENRFDPPLPDRPVDMRSEEHTSELQSHVNLVCRLLLEKKKKHLVHQKDRKKNTHGRQRIRLHSRS